MSWSARRLSRAWLAVVQAAGEDDHLPSLWRAVTVEGFPNGVRLTATDGRWIAQSWVPTIEAGDPDHARHLGFDPEGEPLPEVVPASTVVVIADEWRVRDLFRHLARLTKKADAPDVTVEVDLSVSLYDPDQPTLTEEMAERRAAFEIPGQERVLGRLLEGDPFDWRKIMLVWAAESATTVTAGLPTAMSGWMLAAFARVTTICGTPTINIDWVTAHRGRWNVESAFPYPHVHGVFAAAHRPDQEPPTDGKGDGPNGDWIIAQAIDDFERSTGATVSILRTGKGVVTATSDDTDTSDTEPAAAPKRTARKKPSK